MFENFVLKTLTYTKVIQMGKWLTHLQKYIAQLNSGDLASLCGYRVELQLPRETLKTHPWTTEAAQSMWLGIITIEKFNVVITTVSFLLHLERDEAQLDAVASFYR